MEFNLEKYGYNKKEVDVYLKKLTQEFEQTSQKQRDRIEELQKDIQIVEQELGRYKEKDADISTALVAAVETAKQIEESSKSIYDLEIRRIRSLYDKWQAYLDEMMERYPAMRENFDPSSITAAFKKSIDDVLNKAMDDFSKKHKEDFNNLKNKIRETYDEELERFFSGKKKHKENLADYIENKLPEKEKIITERCHAAERLFKNSNQLLAELHRM